MDGGRLCVYGVRVYLTIRNWWNRIKRSLEFSIRFNDGMPAEGDCGVERRVLCVSRKCRWLFVSLSGDNIGARVYVGGQPMR